MPVSVDLWIAPEFLLDDPGLAARLSALLAPDERERHDRMGTESGRRQQLLARALTREVLSTYARDVSPRDWRFVRSAAGRPSLAPPFDSRGLHFNLAHTSGLVVLAVGAVPEIGVDVEALDKRAPLSVAQGYFSAREASELNALPPEEQPRRFLRLWTLKEAYLKAVGEGLAGGLDSMSFTFDAAGVRFERAADPHAGEWRFREFTRERGQRSYQIALAFLAPDPDAAANVQVHDFR